MLTPKEIFQRLPKPLVQVKAGITSKNLLNEIGVLIYSAEITKKCIPM